MTITTLLYALILVGSLTTGDSRTIKTTYDRSDENVVVVEKGSIDVRVYTDRDAFQRAAERFEQALAKESFSTFLGNATSKKLSVGENTVGSFDIDVDVVESSADTVATISKGDDDLGELAATYEKDTIEIRFDDFKEGKLHAFAATWNVDQVWSDYVNDDEWWESCGDDCAEDWNNDGGGFWGAESGHGKTLHLRIGTEAFNLVHLLYRDQTDFVGFLSLCGFTSIELFTPESGDEAIDFTMSEVIVSAGKPGYENSFQYVCSVFVSVMGYLITIDYTGLFQFIGQFFGR